MTARQYAFIIGVVLVWVAWDTGWVVIPAIIAGLVGLGVLRVFEGDLDLNELADRVTSSSKRR